MPTTTIYSHILDELASGELKDLERIIFHALRRAYPAGLTREQLILEVDGDVPPATENLNNNPQDRKNRMAIASMLGKGIPIVSTSGNAGYRLDVDPKRLEEMIRELENRRDNLNEKISAAKRTLVKVSEAGRNAIPATLPEDVTQLSMEI